MPRKRNAASRDWVCNLSDGTCIDESQLEYIEESIDGLDEAADEYAEKHGFRVPYDGSDNFYDDVDVKASKDAFIAGANWQKQHDAELIEIAYNDGITIGMTKQKEQMMEEAVEMEVGMFGKHLPMLIVTEPMEMKDFPAKHGQTVRVIILPK